MATKKKAGKPRKIQASPETGSIIPHELVAKRAYEKWCRRGKPHGTDEEDWKEARRELLAEKEVPRLLAELGENDESIREMAIGKLTYLGEATLPAIINALNHDSPKVRAGARECFFAICRDFPHPSNLTRSLESDDPELRLHAIQGIVISLPAAWEAIDARVPGWETLAAFAELPIPEAEMVEKSEVRGPIETAIRKPSIHLIRILDRDVRKQAFRTLLELEEMWVRLPGNILGVSTKQAETLEKHGIGFEWVSRTGSHAQTV